MNEMALMRMRKAEILKLLDEKGLKVDPKMTKKEAVAKLLRRKTGRNSAMAASTRPKTKPTAGLGRKKKSELLRILKDLGRKADPKALKKDLIALIMESEPDHPAAAPQKPDAGTPKAKARRARTETVRAVQREVEESKYSAENVAPGTAETEAPAGEKAPEIEESAKTEPLPELPGKYGENRIAAMVRDPDWIFVYWEITPETLERARREVEPEGGRREMSLRVYDVTGKIFDGKNANGWFDIDAVGRADNWYINTGAPGRSFCVEIGLLASGGRFHALARSDVVSTPPAGMSEETDERWMTHGEEFERIYALSGGFEAGKGSAELHEKMQRRLREHLASEAPGSLSGMGAPERDA